MSYYYMVPYNEIPSTPDPNMWFAIWDTTTQTVTWPTTKPSTAPDGIATFCVGVTTTYPTSATHMTQLAAVPATKNPGSPPQLTAYDIPSFTSAFNQWVTAEDRKDGTLPADARFVERE